MRKVWLILVMEATCLAAQPVVGNVAVYPEALVRNTRCAEPFVVPADGTIESISIYHEGGSGMMLLGVYAGRSAPDVRVGITRATPVNAHAGWQTVALTEPVWAPGGASIWLAWVFEKTPKIRCRIATTGWFESKDGWTAGLPGTFGSGSRPGRTCSIYATYAGDVYPVINEVLPRNDALSEREFVDEEWLKQGWIELYNPSDLAIHLENHYLSDSRDALRKWALPDMIMGPRGYLRVWTSGKDRKDPAGELHTSFNLMDSESLFFTCAKPESEVDVLEELRVPVDCSYGRYPDGAGAWYFYTRPTPQSTNTAENKRRFAIDQRHISLSVGTRYQLTVTPPGESVVWRSDNPLVWVDPTGRLLAVQDALGEEARAVITATSASGDCVDSCQVTIVNWAANFSELKVVANPYASYILAAEGDRVFHTKGQDLYVTSDGFKTSQFLSTLPETLDLPKMLVTPFGYFVQCNRTIFRSLDLATWTPSATMTMRGLLQSLAYHWEPASQTGYVYAGEYSCDPNHRHEVCRGVFSGTGKEAWDTVLEFASLMEWEEDVSIPDAARHVHTVAVDPYTGDVWVGTGDGSEHSRLLYSHDNGASFRLLGMGSQAWRCVSIWFTARYVYWSMDAYSNQYCWRIPRSRIDPAGLWPCTTPELTSGTTTTGVNYLVTASQTATSFPVPVGRIYKETQARPLSPKNTVRAIDDPAYDYREKVAELCNGSLWYNMWVHDDRGNPILILAQSAEGAQRDFRGRIFGIKELPDGRVDVQELLSIGSTDPDKYDAGTMFVQLEPRAQDARGNIYFTGRWTDRKTYQAKLRWVDNPFLH